jgi:hypothetical protein
MADSAMSPTEDFLGWEPFSGESDRREVVTPA